MRIEEIQNSPGQGRQATQDENFASFPIDLHVSMGKYYVLTAKIPRTNLRDPFFLDSLTEQFHIANVDKVAGTEQTVLVRPLHYDANDTRIKTIPIETFVQLYKDEEVDTKNMNYIFHMSRCGSTLATQMLAAVDRFYVVSESTMINAVLNPALILPNDVTKTQLLRAVINSIYACKPYHCERVFIKFRSWNTLFIKNILGLYPAVQWMFVNRNGSEVLESVLRDPPGWMRSRQAHSAFFASVLGLNEREVETLSDIEYACRLLGAICSNAKSAESHDSLFVDYIDIAKRLPSILDAAWRLRLSGEEVDVMLKRTSIYSKDPKKAKVFENDSEKKRQLVGEVGNMFAGKYVESIRGKLDNIHK